MNPASRSEDPSASGRIYGSFGSVSLNDILQLLGMTRRTATVFLKYHAKEGTILFRDGLVLHAASGSATGEDALSRLVRWTEADFIIDDGIPESAPETLGKSVDAVMLDVLTKLDESSLDGDVIYTPATPLDKIDLKELETKVRMSRLKPPPPRARRPSAGVGIAVIVLTMLGASAGLFAWQQWSVDADSLPAFTDGAEVRAPAPSPDASIAGDVLEQTLAPMGVDAADVLSRHGVSLAAPAPGPGARAPVAAPEPAPVESPYGFLLVLAEPWGEVRVDGERLGQTPLPAIELAAGEHDVELSNPNFVGVMRDRVRVPAGETASVRFSFNEQGSLRVLVTPWADVYVDGQHVGQTPFDALAVSVGEHRVRLTHPSLGERTESVVIRRGESAVLKVVM